MIQFIDERRDVYGVVPVCRVLPNAPSTYYVHRARMQNPQLRAKRVQRDQELRPEIERIWKGHFAVYGANKVWHQLRRENIPAARCTVARLMRGMGLRGAVRGRAFKVTTLCQDSCLNN
jgi:putative transposase